MAKFVECLEQAAQNALKEANKRVEVKQSSLAALKELYERKQQSFSLNREGSTHWLSSSAEIEELRARLGTAAEDETKLLELVHEFRARREELTNAALKYYAEHSQ